MGKVGVFPTVGENMKNDVTQADIDHLKSLSEKELRELFKKVDWSDIDPTIEEIENELERDVDRYMSLTAKEYRNEMGIKMKKPKKVKPKKIYNIKKFVQDVRKHGTVKIYTPEEVRAFNIARGLI